MIERLNGARVAFDDVSERATSSSRVYGIGSTGNLKGSKMKKLMFVAAAASAMVAVADVTSANICG